MPKKLIERTQIPDKKICVLIHPENVDLYLIGARATDPFNFGAFKYILQRSATA